MPIPLKLDAGRLRQQDIKRYWEDGFLFPIPAVSPDAALEFRRQLEAIETEWTHKNLPQPLNTYKRVNAQCVMPLAYQIGAEPGILNVVEGILGPDILIYAVEFFIKEPKTRHKVTMHQDLTYWGLGATSEMVTAWLALSPATRQSGCMDFVRGSHKNPILPHKDSFAEDNLLSRGQEVQVHVAEQDKTSIEIQPGEISLHHGLTIHGSGPNISDDRRIAAVIRYVTPNVAQEIGARDYAILARGADRQGNFIHVAPPKGLFNATDLQLHEEIRVAQAAAKMKNVKAKKGLFA